MPFKAIIKGDSHYDLVSGGVRRNEEVDAIYRRIVEAALDARPDVFVDLGDLTDKPRPSPEAYAMIISNLAVLTAEGIPVLVVPGNHGCSYRADGVDAEEPLRMIPWPGAGVHVPRLAEPWRPPGRDDVEILPFPFLPAARKPEGYESVQDYYDRMARAWLTASSKAAGRVVSAAGERPPPTYRLAVAHLNLLNARKAAGDAVVRDIDLRVPDVLVGQVPVFCGHLHAYQVLRAAAPPAVVVGSTQYVDFGEARDRKGYVVYEAP